MTRLGKHNKRKGQRGFTILELVIVIVAIAILASVAILQYTQVREAALLDAMRLTLDQVNKNLQTFNITDPGATAFPQVDAAAVTALDTGSPSIDVSNTTGAVVTLSRIETGAKTLVSVFTQAGATNQPIQKGYGLVIWLNEAGSGAAVADDLVCRLIVPQTGKASTDYKNASAATDTFGSALATGRMKDSAGTVIGIANNKIQCGRASA